jgi:hypothetical protein
MFLPKLFHVKGNSIFSVTASKIGNAQDILCSADHAGQEHPIVFGLHYDHSC